MHSNFNPHNIMAMGGNQFGMTSDEQLLEQLRYMSTYGTHNQTTLMLLHELHLRSARCFSKTFTPTKDVQGDYHLYTSIFKNGRMHHFFVADDETKRKIEQVIEQTTLDPKDGPSQFGVERIGLLMELGDVFKVVTVDESGKQLGDVKNSGFAALFGGWGFDEQTKHTSKVLPLAVLEASTLTILNSDPKHIFSTVISQAIHLVTNREQLNHLEAYLLDGGVLKEYIAAVTDAMRLNDIGVGYENVTQLHLFPAGRIVPIKFLGGLDKKWDTGFIKREQYPHLFPVAQGYMHPNGNVGGFNGFGAGKGPWA